MEIKTLGYVGLINAILAFAVQAPMGYVYDLSSMGITMNPMNILIFYLVAGAVVAVGSVLVISGKNEKMGGMLLIVGGIVTLIFGLIGIVAGALVLRQGKIKKR